MISSDRGETDCGEIRKTKFAKYPHDLNRGGTEKEKERWPPVRTPRRTTGRIRQRRVCLGGRSSQSPCSWRCPPGVHVVITRDSGVCGHRAQERGLDCRSLLKPSHALGNRRAEKGGDGFWEGWRMEVRDKGLLTSPAHRVRQTLPLELVQIPVHPHCGLYLRSVKRGRVAVYK